MRSESWRYKKPALRLISVWVNVQSVCFFDVKRGLELRGLRTKRLKPNSGVTLSVPQWSFEQRPVRMFCVRLVATVPNHVLRLVSVLDNVKFESLFLHQRCKRAEIRFAASFRFGQRPILMFFLHHRCKRAETPFATIFGFGHRPVQRFLSASALHQRFFFSEACSCK